MIDTSLCRAKCGYNPSVSQYNQKSRDFGFEREVCEPFWILHRNCPSSCVRYLIMLLLLVQLMLCRAAAWVLNIEWEQVQASCKLTGEETDTNNKPYPALKCPSSPWMSAVPSFPCVHNSHSSQSQTTKWCRCTDYTISYTILFAFLHYVWVLDLAVINGWAAGAGER